MIWMVLLLILLGAGFLWREYRHHKKLRQLTAAIDDFLLKGEAIPISTEDSDFGHLQTNVHELQERYLQQQAYNLAQARSNTQFLSDISHQLKTPLAALELYSEMGEGIYRDKQLLLIRKMETLIQKVLTLEKLRGEGYEMHFAPCDLERLAGRILGEMRPLFPEKEFVLMGSGSIRADEGWLGEALTNVVKNACEHTLPRGRVEIGIEAGESSVHVRISDDGGGVPPEELNHLFDRFHRTANALPTSAGIGLAITRAIVTRHHGIIEASNGEKGLSIHICLPILEGNLKIE